MADQQSGELGELRNLLNDAMTRIEQAVSRARTGEVAEPGGGGAELYDTNSSCNTGCTRAEQ